MHSNVSSRCGRLSQMERYESPCSCSYRVPGTSIQSNSRCLRTSMAGSGYARSRDLRARARKIGTAARRPRGLIAPGAIDSAWRKEDLSITFLHGLAASVGVTCDHDRRDINGWDVHLSARDTEAADALQLSVQLKCTVGRITLLANQRELSFPVGRDDYDNLRKTPCHPPRILVVVQVPDHHSPSWVDLGPDRLVVNARAWYQSLAGRGGLPEGQDSVSVRIPTSNRLTPQALLGQMRSCP